MCRPRPVVFCLCQCRGAWGPARLPGLPKPPSASSTHVSISAPLQASGHANIGTAGFASGRGLGDRRKAWSWLCVPNKAVFSVVLLEMQR